MFVALPFKILVDSRAATTGTSESFQVSLPETLHLNPDIVMYVNSATCTNTFLPTGTVVGAQRNTIYFLERQRGAAMILNKATLPERTYDAEELAAALQTAMNASSWLSSDYTCTYNVAKQTISISRPTSDQSFFIVNDDLLSDPAFKSLVDPRTALFEAYDLDFNNTKSAHELLGLGRGSSVNTKTAQMITIMDQQDLAYAFETGAVAVRRVNNVYVHSQALSTRNVISLMAGARTTICKIPVLGQVGDVLHRAHSGHHLDFIDVGNKMLTTLDFEVRDAQNRLLNLRGGTLTLELLFAQRPI